MPFDDNIRKNDGLDLSKICNKLEGDSKLISQNLFVTQKKNRGIFFLTIILHFKF